MWISKEEYNKLKKDQEKIQEEYFLLDSKIDFLCWILGYKIKFNNNRSDYEVTKRRDGDLHFVDAKLNALTEYLGLILQEPTQEVKFIPKEPK